MPRFIKNHTPMPKLCTYKQFSQKAPCALMNIWHWDACSYMNMALVPKASML